MKEKYNKEYVNDWTFTTANYVLFFIGVLFVIFGYLLMYTGEVTSYQSVRVAPFFLVIGYCVIIPVSLLYKK